MRLRFRSNRRRSLRWNLEPLGKEIRDELARFGPQAGMPELLDRWPDAVGEGIARNAWPARIAKDGTVHVNTADSIWAFELGQRAAAIAERLGVPRLRFAPGPLPETDAELPQPALEPSPEDDEMARAMATAVTDEMLRESVQKAVRLSLARERRDRPI
jgi:hypothetical protein